MEASIYKIAYGIAVLSMYAIPVSHLMGGAIESAFFIISLVLSMAWFGREGLKPWLITNIAVVASDVSRSSCILSIAGLGAMRRLVEVNLRLHASGARIVEDRPHRSATCHHV